MVITAKRKNQTSILGSRHFSKWVEAFDVNEPSFVKLVNARDQKSTKWMDDLQRRMSIAEREYQNVRVNV